MASRLILHAGQHKTGTTSIQSYLGANRAALAGMGLAVCTDTTPELSRERTTPLAANAMFIANAVVRASLETPVRLNGICRPLPSGDAAVGLRAVNQRIRAMREDTAVLSAEALAFLRETDEMQRLEILCEGLEWQTIMFLREPASWLRSWKTEVTHGPLRHTPGVTPESGIFDFSPQSWLVDHAAIRAFWGSRGTFIDYEQATSSHGSVIPAFLSAAGLNPELCPPWDKFYLNSSAAKTDPQTQ